MKKIILTSVLSIILLTIVLSNSVFSGEELKIGYINSAKILREYKETKSAQEMFDREMAALDKRAKEMADEIEKLEKEYESQKLMLSPERRAEKEKLIENKKTEYYNYIQSAQEMAYRRNAELSQPIIDKINAILQKIGSSENYTIIFDAVNSNIVYAKDSIDLTDRVITELNKEAGGTTPSTGGGKK